MMVVTPAPAPVFDDHAPADDNRWRSDDHVRPVHLDDLVGPSVDNGEHVNTRRLRSDDDH
jgi:hypothetical protein